jgi:light-regulated signal transduction histidine kinase (bacteriophytochrome)
VLSVEDNGIGIAPEYAQNIFKLFGRLHSDNEYEGLGVGLATCQRIAEFHNGTINLDFSYEGGSRFVVKMPFE